MILKGNKIEVLLQLQGLVAYYGKDTKLSEVIENEKRLGEQLQDD